MKSLTDIFPKASKSFVDVNPQPLPSAEAKRGTTGNSGGAKVHHMNRTEAEYALILEAQKRNDGIDGWRFEAIRLNLAERTTYTPDFLTWTKWTFRDDSGKEKTWLDLRFIEIKGFKRDDAMVKFKVAREQFEWATFEMWRKDRKLGWTQIK